MILTYMNESINSFMSPTVTTILARMALLVISEKCKITNCVWGGGGGEEGVNKCKKSVRKRGGGRQKSLKFNFNFLNFNLMV